jgi:hypothetical protein
MHAAHPQNLAGTAVLQPQKFIHDSILICGLCAAKNNFLRILSLGLANWQQTVRRSDLAVNILVLLAIRKLASQKLSWGEVPGEGVS